MGNGHVAASAAAFHIVKNAFAEKGRKASWPELKKAIGDKAYEEVISTFVLE